jgi:hypothetical protein
MQWLLGTFSQGWNRARMRRGHVFQGRYKSVPVTGTDADAYYFRIVADYIHLNPARAGFAGGRRGPLTGYKWSSLPSYMPKLPKSDGRKVVLAALLRDRTSVGNSWIAKRLSMGHSGSVSRMIGTCRKSGELTSTFKPLSKALTHGAGACYSIADAASIHLTFRSLLSRIR